MNQFESPKKLILIVEDEYSMRKVLSDRFRSEGYETDEATNGKDGLAKAILKHPDILIIDVLMPGMDGLTLLRELRKSGEYGRKVPAIMLTNLNPDKDEITNAVAEGEPAYYLMKVDMSVDDLLEKVREILNRS